MLLSRFWYILLAALAVTATAAALLAQSVINGRSDEALTHSLTRDRVIVEAMLRLEARSRLDRMAFITVDNKFGALLRQANGVTDDKRLRELSAAVKEVMRGHVARIIEASQSDAAAQQATDVAPDIAFALDGDGRIIAQLGPLEANPPGASLSTFPLVKRALQGYLRDDVWVYDRRVYRVAARPVMSGSEYAGVVVHGYRLDKGLPERLAKNLGGATVGFFFGTEVLESYAPPDATEAPQRAEIASALPQALAAPKFQTGSSSELLALQGGSRAIFAKITGAAAAVGVGYVIARPRNVVSSPEAFFQQASQDDVKALPFPMLAAAFLVLSLVGLLFLYIERDRHLKQLMKKTAEIGAGARDRLIVTEWRGGYRKLADKINQAIDKEVEKAAEHAPTSRKKANLDEILGPTPEATGTPFFSFASDDDKPASTPGPLSPAVPSPRPGLPKSASSPGAQRAPASPPPPAPPLPRPPAPASPVAGTASLPVAMSPQGAEDGASFDEGAHWHDIYDQYVATRRQCAEPTDNLTYDKFAVTLKKTRDQVIEKHGAKSVRFAVQIKEGKAALKAQPVKR